MRKYATALVAVCSLLLAQPAGANHSLGHLKPYQVRAKHAIMQVFGPQYGPGAVRVAWCESHLTRTATNGQYLGIFQMGDWERSKYGHGSGAWAQAKAAYRYFISSGRDWSPWSCRWAA